MISGETTMILFFLGIALGLLIGLPITRGYYTEKFTQTKCARYSPITVEFEIIKEIK